MSNLQYWHPTLNTVDPSSLSPKSNREVWWKCQVGHAWKARYGVFMGGNGTCPFCSHRKLLTGFNDVETLHPELVVSWSPANTVTPSDFLASSSTKAEWVCARGHARALTVAQALRSSECPICADPLPDHLHSEWDELKNSLSATDVNRVSSLKAWWVCDKGHSWEAMIRNRSLGSGCPVCLNRQVNAGFNDLGTVRPDLALLWDVSNSSHWSEIMVSSSAEALWAEECGHSYWLAICKRAKAKQCQVCANRVIVPGVNDFASQEPQLLTEWDTELNTVDPQTLPPQKNLRVWWKCQIGHSWQASMNDRVNYRTGCPACQGTVVVAGLNDVSTTHPEVLPFWHDLRDPMLHSSGSDTRITWMCPEKHVWSTSIQSVAKQGTRCAVCSERKVWVGKTDLATTSPRLAQEWDSELNNLSPSEVSRSSNKLAWWRCSEGHSWKTSVNNRTAGKGCQRCSAKAQASQAEKELQEFFLSHGVTVDVSNRSLLQGQEIDLYIPESNLAIEFNGLYWHAEPRRGRNYHRDKWVACKELGVQLIQIWEDDWVSRPEIIKSMLLRKLGKSSQPSVGARKCSVVMISTQEARDFFEGSHVQGFASASYYVALQHDSVTVAVIALKKEPGTGGTVLNIVRYATSVNVPGGFTKLVAYASRVFQPEKFITFSDHCISDGALYEKHGFVAEAEIRPDYKYVVKKKREHKFSYRLKRFRSDPGLLYEEGLTESELAELNKLPRIWDAGKTRWVKVVA